MSNRAIPCFLALCLTPLAVGPLAVPAAPALQAAQPCDDLWVRNPLVSYDVSGWTFAYQVHRHVAVYDDGLVTFADMNIPVGDLQAGSIQLEPAVAADFHRRLVDAGAFEVCDDQAAGGDIPLSTLTVFRPLGLAAAVGVGDSRKLLRLAHTANWYDPSGPLAPIQDLIDDFIATNLPNL